MSRVEVAGDVVEESDDLIMKDVTQTNVVRGRGMVMFLLFCKRFLIKILNKEKNGCI